MNYFIPLGEKIKISPLSYFKAKQMQLLLAVMEHPSMMYLSDNKGSQMVTSVLPIGKNLNTS